MSQYFREQQSPRGLRALRYEQLIVPWSSEAPPPAKHHDILQRVKKIAPRREDKKPEKNSVLTGCMLTALVRNFHYTANNNSRWCIRVCLLIEGPAASKRIIKSLTEDKDEKASLLRSEDMTVVEELRTISNASKGKLHMGLSNFDTAGLALQGHYRQMC